MLPVTVPPGNVLEISVDTEARLVVMNAGTEDNPAVAGVAPVVRLGISGAGVDGAAGAEGEGSGVAVEPVPAEFAGAGLAELAPGSPRAEVGVDGTAGFAELASGPPGEALDSVPGAFEAAGVGLSGVLGSTLGGPEAPGLAGFAVGVPAGAVFSVVAPGSPAGALDSTPGGPPGDPEAPGLAGPVVSTPGDSGTPGVA